MSASVTHAQAYVFDRAWGTAGSGNGQFVNPFGIAVDSLGNVYVTDTAPNDRIQKFDSNGIYLTQWGSSGAAPGLFSAPHGVAVDSSGYVYVADTTNNRIQKIDSSGTALLVLGGGAPSMANGHFSAPWGVAVDSLGNIYVADTTNNRIQKFDSTGTYLTQWGAGGSAGPFSAPSGIAVDSSGYVYVADTTNDRIQKFDSNGNFITTWGTNGAGNGQFYSPYGVAVDSLGNVYVGDTTPNNRIQKFDSNGNFITTWGSSGSADGLFNGLHGVAVDSSCHVYAVDTINERIQKFSGSCKTISLQLAKSASSPTYSTAGQTITYTYNVTNTGNLDIAGPINIIDDKFNTITVQNDALLAGQSAIKTVPYTITLDDFAKGYVTNLAYATNNVINSNTATQIVTGPAPIIGLHLVKSASSPTYSAAGQTIIYTYNVTNTGTVDIAGPINITDDKSNTIITVQNDALLAGHSATTTVPYTITPDDFAKGSVTNLAHATNNVINSNTATQIVTGPAPIIGLQLVKAASSPTYSTAGQTITYTYNVTNTGTVDIAGPIKIIDDMFGTITVQNDALLAGHSATTTVPYTITSADFAKGSVTNLAYAIGSFNGNTITSPKNIAVVLYEHPEHQREHPNNERDFGPNYGGAFVPIPMMYGSPMYGNESCGGGSELNSIIKVPNSNSCDCKVKAPLSKHKHKNHSKQHKTKHNTTKQHKTKHNTTKQHKTKQHKTEQKTLSIKVDKK